MCVCGHLPAVRRAGQPGLRGAHKRAYRENLYTYCEVFRCEDPPRSITATFSAFCRPRSTARPCRELRVRDRDPSGQSAGSDPRTATVSIDTGALKLEKFNITAFGKTLEVIRDKTIFRNSTDFTFVGSTGNGSKNVFVTVFGDRARMEIGLPGRTMS